ncbi:MAG: amino acid ABC transporter permease [Clostridia bacterium]|nr:amino acid ABC transporter permease [Clostridia bacterium]
MDERTWQVVVDAFPVLLEYGLKVTIPLTLLAFALGIVIAVITAVIRYARVPVLRQLAQVYIWIIRGTPLLVQLYLIFYGLPKVGVVLEAFPTAVLVFAFNEGAYMAESVRAALESVPREQIEAGQVAGKSALSILGRVVLPQAFRVALPSLSNSFISMMKGTSLAANITVTEMFRQAQVLVGTKFEPLALYTEAALIYLVFCTVVELLQRLLERRLSRYERVRDERKKFFLLSFFR